MNNTNLAIIGGGNMGRALLAGLLRRGMEPTHIRVGERLTAACASLSQDFGITATPDICEAADSADLLILAVKPQDAAAVLGALARPLSTRRPLVLSVAAGLRVAALERWCAGAPVLRAMPNRPALVGAGITGLFAPSHVESSHRAAAERVMSAVGEVVWVPTEDALDVVTAVSGSGPAYFFLVAELMAQAGSELGLPPETARRLAAATLHGAGMMAAASDADLARLRSEVTSKGGTTAAALSVLEAADLRALIATALKAAAARSHELGVELEKST
jgi:pyrroline-5-carboxylate reductase